MVDEITKKWEGNREEKTQNRTAFCWQGKEVESETAGEEGTIRIRRKQCGSVQRMPRKGWLTKATDLDHWPCWKSQRGRMVLVETTEYTAFQGRALHIGEHLWKWGGNGQGTLHYTSLVLRDKRRHSSFFSLTQAGWSGSEMCAMVMTSTGHIHCKIIRKYVSRTLTLQMRKLVPCQTTRQIWYSISGLPDSKSMVTLTA